MPDTRSEPVIVARRADPTPALVKGETRFTVAEYRDRVFLAMQSIANENGDSRCLGCCGESDDTLCDALPACSVSSGVPRVFMEDTPEGRAHYAAALLTGESHG